MIINIVHFVFGLKKQTEEFLFCYFLSVYSAYIINNPDIWIANCHCGQDDCQ